MRGPMMMPRIDGIAHRHVVEGAIDADVAHRGKSGEQSDARIGNGGIRGFYGAALQHIERFSVGEIGQVGMAVDESGKHGHVRQVDDLGAIRNGEIGSDGLDFRAADHNDLVRERAARLHVDELAGADGGDAAPAPRCRQPQRRLPAGPRPAAQEANQHRNRTLGSEIIFSAQTSSNCHDARRPLQAARS